jgi:AraC-like DNA-binding protein/mannose-6-phosphate isomerase-like protein (cupin superfamily)
MAKLTQQLLATLHGDHERNMRWIETSKADVLVHSSNPPKGFAIPWHEHRRTQLLCVFSGILLVVTIHGRWMVPAGHALVIPSGLPHSVEILSDISMRSVYMAPTDPGSEPEETLRVVEVTDLARSLIFEAIRLQEASIGNRKAELVLALLIEEISALENRPLGLPFPSDRRLAALCRDYLANPDPNVRLDDWAEQMAVSRRTFTRQFRKETGISFTTWRQQASVFACLPQLTGGKPITTVALEAGYESVAAFTTMFRRVLGTSPRNYMTTHSSFGQR